MSPDQYRIASVRAELTANWRYLRRQKDGWQVLRFPVGESPNA